MGHVASIVSNLSNARKDFQGKKNDRLFGRVLSVFSTDLKLNWMLSRRTCHYDVFQIISRIVSFDGKSDLDDWSFNDLFLGLIIYG